MNSAAFTFVFNLKDKMSPAMRKISSVSRGAYGKLISAQRQYNSELNRGNRAARQMGTTVGTLGNMIKGYLGYRAVGSFFKLGAGMEQTRITFQTLLKDVSKGNKMFENINTMANLTPYKNSTLQQGARTMLSFGISESDTMKALQMIGDVASGNADKFKSLTLAYSQVQSAGRLMGQDLLQLINAGFNPLKVISEQTGLSMAELKDKMGKGAISAKMVSDAFKVATSEGGIFHNMMKKQSQPLGGKWSTFIGKGELLISKFAMSTGNAVTKMLDKLIALVDWIDKNKVIVEALVVTIGSAVAAYYAWIAVSKLWMAALAVQKSVMFVVIGLTRGWAVAQRALNLTLMANPIGIIIGLIAALTVGVIYAWNKFEGFRAVILGSWEVVKGFGNLLKEYVIDRIKEFIKGITGLGNTLALIFKGKWKEAAKQGKRSLANLFGADSKRKAYENGKQVTEWYNKGATKAASASKIKLPNALNLGADTNIASLASMTDDNLANSTTGKTVNSIVGGGKKTVNINTTIERLVDKLYIQSANVQEGAEEMRDIIQAELNRALNGIVVQGGI